MYWNEGNYHLVNNGPLYILCKGSLLQYMLQYILQATFL